MVYHSDMIVFDFDGVISDSVKWFDDLAIYLSSLGRVENAGVLEWMIRNASARWLRGEWDDERFVEEINLAFPLTIDLADVEEACRRSMRIDERVYAILTRLESTAVFTDNPRVRARIIQELVPSAQVTYSQLVGKRKHDPSGFEGFVRESGITRGLFIDDYPPNIEAARKAGFETLRWQLGKDSYDELESAIRSAR